MSLTTIISILVCMCTAEIGIPVSNDGSTLLHSSQECQTAAMSLKEREEDMETVRVGTHIQSVPGGWGQV